MRRKEKMRNFSDILSSFQQNGLRNKTVVLERKKAQKFFGVDTVRCEVGNIKIVIRWQDDFATVRFLNF